METELKCNFFYRALMMSDFAKDLEHWMTNLPDEIRSTPIINLAIPGSMVFVSVITKFTTCSFIFLFQAVMIPCPMVSLKADLLLRMLHQ